MQQLDSITCTVNPWSLLDALSDGLALIDAEGSLRYLNAAWHQLIDQLDQLEASETNEDGNGTGTDSDALRTQPRAGYRKFTLGAKYISCFHMAFAPDNATMDRLIQGVRAILVGERDRFDLSCPHLPKQECTPSATLSPHHEAKLWWVITIMPYVVDGHRGALVQQRLLTLPEQNDPLLQRFAAIIEATSDGIGIADAHGHIIFRNPAHCRMTGTDEDETPEMTNIASHHPQWALAIVEQYGLPTAIREGSWCGETALRTRDGQELPISQVINAHKAADGTIEFFSSIMRDMTKQKQVEAALREEKERFRTIFNGIGMGILLTDAQGKIIKVNPRFEEMIGYTEQELCQKTFADLTHPDDLALSRGVFKQAIAGESGLYNRFEKRYIRKDGSTLWIRMTSSLLRDETGAMLNMIGMAEDISEQKRVEHVMQAQEARLRELATPLLRISDESVLLPLVGEIDAERIQQIIRALLEGVGATRARIVLLDITGVIAIDVATAEALIRATQAVRMLGAEIILTGIRPDVARALVKLGVDLRGMMTLGTLQSGIAMVMGKRGG